MLKDDLLNEHRLLIGQVVKMTGLHKDTIRRYCDKGVIKCSRNPVNNYRVFDLKEVDKLLNILNGQQNGK